MNRFVRIIFGTALLLLLAGAATAQSFPPVLNPIGAQSVNENLLLSFTVSASDSDLTTPVLTTSTASHRRRVYR